MPKLSCVVITRNEEFNLPRLLKSIEGLVDDLVIVDSRSTDQSRSVAHQICSGLGICLQWAERDWEGYGPTKNAGNGMAQFDWILSLDADEEVTQELREELLAWKGQAREPNINQAWRVNRRTAYCGDWVRHSGWSPDWHIRLFNRQGAKWNLSSVHEALEFSGAPDVCSFQGRLNHFTINTIEEHLERINRYSSLGAEDVLKKYGSSPPSPMGGAFRGLFRGFRHYVLELGFLDGWRGFSIAVLSGYAVFLKYLKAYAKRQG